MHTRLPGVAENIASHRDETVPSDVGLDAQLLCGFGGFYGFSDVSLCGKVTNFESPHGSRW